MGTWASIQPKRVSSTLQEGGTPVILLARVHADVLLWMPAMPDLGTSLRLGNISSTFKGMPDAPSLPVIVRFGCLASPVPCQTVGPNFPSVVPDPKFCCPGHPFGICLASLWTAISCRVLMCVGARNVRRPTLVLMPVADSIRHWPEPARPPPPPAPCCLYQICI